MANLALSPRASWFPLVRTKPAFRDTFGLAGAPKGALAHCRHLQSLRALFGWAAGSTQCGIDGVFLHGAQGCWAYGLGFWTAMDESGEGGVRPSPPWPEVLAGVAVSQAAWSGCWLV
jgi:hypothetical protein